jgi:hypothetical protein
MGLILSLNYQSGRFSPQILILERNSIHELLKWLSRSLNFSFQHDLIPHHVWHATLSHLVNFGTPSTRDRCGRLVKCWCWENIMLVVTLWLSLQLYNPQSNLRFILLWEANVAVIVVIPRVVPWHVVASRVSLRMQLTPKHGGYKWKSSHASHAVIDPVICHPCISHSPGSNQPTILSRVTVHLYSLVTSSVRTNEAR